MGKQHGVGIFQNEEGGKLRKGEWVQGKRIRWISDDEYEKMLSRY